jgi:hypothetical protein
VRSLTLIEPPLYLLVPDDPEAVRLERLGDAVLKEGLDADPTMLREFLRLAVAENIDDGPLPDHVARGVRRAHGGRDQTRRDRRSMPWLTPAFLHSSYWRKLCGLSSRLAPRPRFTGSSWSPRARHRQPGRSSGT